MTLAYCQTACVHGDCTKPNTCTCDTGYDGHFCSEFTCDPPCQTGHGACIGPNNCYCNYGWDGEDCSNREHFILSNQVV